MERPTLNVDLYDNLLTGQKGDYTARPRITGTLHNKEIAARIVAARSEYRQETIEHILTLADQAKVEAIAEGKSVVDGVGQYLITVRGTFVGENAQFDPAQHSLGISYTTGKMLREQLKNVNVVSNGAAQTGPVINAIVDSTTGSENDLLTSAGPAVIRGSQIKVAGSDPSVGVFLTADEPDAEPVKVPLMIHNTPSELTVMMPALDDDKVYTLSVVTQYSTGGKSLKSPRSYTFPILLGKGTKPDGGGGDSGDGGDDTGESPDPIV